MSFFHRVLSFCMSVYIYWLSAQKMKRINKKLKSSLLPKWVVFVSGRHLESLSHLSPVARTWVVQKWACEVPVKTWWSLLLKGARFPEPIPNWGAFPRHSHLVGLDSSFCPLDPWWSHRAAWPHPRVRGHPQGEWPPCAWFMPPDLHSPRIWLRRSLFSYWFCDFFKKISFVFFQLCSAGGLVSVTRLPLPEPQLLP